MRLGWVLFLVLSCMLATAAFALTNGLYAILQTDLGGITCRLHYAQAPLAVANFVGLAEGQRSWIYEETSSLTSNRFYDGLIFHRVIPGFMIQGGCPLGTGTSGPGYRFIDEFDPALRHSSSGVLSMANSGKDSNGSQFFITLSAQAQLDDVHTVFGHVVAGQSVVSAIGDVARNPTNNKPYTNVYMNSISIERIGAEAQAFNIYTQALPKVTGAMIQATDPGVGECVIDVGGRAECELFVSQSSNLNTWSSQCIYFYSDDPEGGDAVVSTPTNSPVFIRATRIDYTGLSTTPTATNTPAGKYLHLDITSHGWTRDMYWDTTHSGTGSVYHGVSTNEVYESCVWVRDVYRAQHTVYSDQIVPMVNLLSFDTPTNGSFEGTFYASTPFDCWGTFYLSDR